MASNTASQIATALTSLLANIRSRWILRLAAVAGLVLTAIDGGTMVLRAQQPPQISDSSLAPNGSPQAGSFLLTIFLKHDESKTLDQINAQLKAQGFYRAFPPEGTQVVSWYVMMGIGQVVTLRVPAERLREVNRVIEQTAWGGYRTEFYATYDYQNIGEDAHAKALVQ
ncbi:MAG: hypothetical protein ACTHJS_18720 [Xanthobacteraceae bacterium]